MFNEEERKEELNQTIYLSGDISCDDILDEIISQEKAMIEQAIKDECNKCYGVGIMGYKPAIEQAKKEAREEFATKLKRMSFWKSNPGMKILSESDIDKLLKEYEE
jgi:hypothetical protein